MGQPGGLLLAATALAALASAATSALAWARPGGATSIAGWGRRLLIAAAVLAVAATGTLAIALLTNDFSLTYVADHSRRGASGAYRLGGLWGGMAGSLLFWTTLLAVVAAIGARARRPSDAHPTPTRGHPGRPASPLRHTPEPAAVPVGIEGADAPRSTTGSVVVTVLATTVAAFALTTLLLANPFETLTIPAIDGGGLTPILEHPAMLYHPPLLYLGLVTLVVPFALTIGDLVRGDGPDVPTGVAIRRWMVVSWTLLALGMVTGANWAYVEVGWGGYWAWDPIENTALVPWLVTTAHLHARQRSGRSRLPAALVLAAFVAASIGTVLTRSGAASSVHAFAQATAVGRALLAIVAALVVASVAALRSARPRDPRRRDAPPRAWRLTRELLLGVQVCLVLAAVALVMIGMLAPIVVGWVTGDESVVDGPFYARTTAPLAVLALLLTGLGPRLDPSPRSVPMRAGELSVPVAAGLLTVALFGSRGWRDAVTLALAGAAGFAAASALQLGWRAAAARRPVAGHVAHLGLAVLLLGVAGSTAATSRTVSVGAGRTLAFDGLELTSEGAHSEPGPPPRVVAPVVVTRRSSSQRLTPAIDGYPERGAILAETALWSTPLEDVQVALRRADDDGNALFDVRVRPLTPLVWWGGGLLVLSGIVALRTSSTRRRQPTPVDPAPVAAAATPSDRRPHD